LSGCARLPVWKEVPFTPETILASLEMSQGSFQRYSARGTLQLHTDTASVVLDCRWEIRLPDTIRIQLYGPMGLRLGDLWVRGEKVEIMNYWMDLRETLSLNSIVKRFPGMVEVSSVKELYPFPMVSRRLLSTIDLENSQPELGTLVFEDSTGQHHFQLDRKHVIITRESFQKSPQDSLLIKEYKSYRRVGKSWLPSRIRYSNGQSQHWMEVFFPTIKVRNNQ
jgi:hypothetical protein